MKSKSLFLILIFATTNIFGQWYAGLTNPNVNVTLTHPPSLMLKINRLAFYPQYDQSSREITDYLISYFVNDGRIEVIDREHLNQILREQNLSISGRINPSTAARLGELLGPAAFVFVKVYRDNHEKKRLTEKYKSDGVEKLKYISKITCNLKVSFQTSDLTTGRIFSANIYEMSRSRENTDYEGYPEYPSVEVLRGELIKESTVNVSHFFLSWEENLSPVFFNDDECGMKKAYKILEAGNLEDATKLSRKAVECAESGIRIKNKHKSRTYYNLGMCYMLMRNYDKAVDNFSKAYMIKDYNMYKTAIKRAKKAKQLAIDLLKVEEMAEIGSQPAAPVKVNETPAEPETPESVDSGEDDIEKKLLKLKKYYEKGLITEKEYNEKRAELLKKL